MSTTLAVREAASARAAGVAAPADRPRDRRNDAAPGAAARALVHLSGVRVHERKAGDDTPATLRFEGCASTTETPYEMYDFWGPYTEVVSAGAFEKTLGADPDVAFLLNHGGMTLARTKSGTLQLSEDPKLGLMVGADLDPRNSDVANIASGMQRGDLDEMSFAFRIAAGLWSPDYTEFRITEVDLHRGDVSIVNYGANPTTSSALRSGAAIAALAQLDAGSIARAQHALDARRSELGLLTPRELWALDALVSHP